MFPIRPNNFALFTPSGASTNAWQTWQKPAGCSFVYIMQQSAGGAGGNGFSAAQDTARGGGGSGGSGSLITFFFPAFLLPDILFLQPGQGGSGAGAGSLVVPNTGITPIAANALINITAGGGVGGNGTASAAGAAGSAGPSSGIQSFARASFFTATGGVAGALGGAHTGATGVAILPSANGWLTTPGTGGGGCTTATFAGGAISAGPFTPALAGGLAGARGLDGYSTFGPTPAFTGGTGGGSSNTGTGGDGGNGGFGSGGGGGGAGVTGGTGGRGGNGFIYISWGF